MRKTSKQENKSRNVEFSRIFKKNIKSILCKRQHNIYISVVNRKNV